jgi:MFS family permease
MDRAELKDTSAADGRAPSSEPNIPSTRRDFRFWSIIFALCTTGILSALEGTVVSTALPTIVRDLGGGSNYLWAANAYFLTCTAFQPLYGQTANIFGRRYLLIFAVGVFALGSGISGGASSMGMLIAGRAIQGIGGGGIVMLSNLIVSDIVPLRERGTYMAILFAAMTLGNGAGPFIGGIIVEKGSWRWVSA